MEKTPPGYDVIVFSHLRWEFVFQRPQHIISRIAKERKVLFVEEPIPFQKKERGTAKIFSPSQRVTVLQPRISPQRLHQDLAPLIQKWQKKLQFQNPVLWFYSSAFSPLADQLTHSLVVYDCMDELSAFKGAPPSLMKLEKNLLQFADVVFTGGKSLYESKKQINQEVYCFPSSVERTHFQKALSPLTLVPKELLAIPSPRVGFYGVIDERLDLDLLKKCAESLPTVSFVMIGPVVKINTNDLPRSKNIYYLGEKSYAELPNYLKGFDVAMMPFALNQATRFISPTKTLEFMAAERPIVSTPIYDVQRDYSREVTIAQTAPEFTKAIVSCLSESAQQRKERTLLQRQVISHTSWDNTVARMKAILHKKMGAEQWITSTSSSLPLTQPATFSIGT